MDTPIKLIIPEAYPLLNAWHDFTWHKRRQYLRRYSRCVRDQYTHIDPPIDRCAIYVIRHSAGIRPDKDSLYAGLKPILDSLVVRTDKNPSGNGIILDDADDVLVKLSVTAERCKRVDTRTEIYIIKEKYMNATKVINGKRDVIDSILKKLWTLFGRDEYNHLHFAVLERALLDLASTSETPWESATKIQRDAVHYLSGDIWNAAICGVDPDYIRYLLTKHGVINFRKVAN